ncbi:ATP-binding protein [Providencia rettgeri]|uniref:ATP-binding protein n=1 Tax=Providencia rettgeri TaxID=587 RepID=UPI000BCF64E9|nr:AAA family ATPase [Providencia rettgeri]PCQ39479.1 hypothetical protein CQA26_02260 [Providencia rettgeri]
MKKYRSIKVLQKDALVKNSIKSQYQLYSYYKHGDFVEKDQNEADRYLRMLDNNFQTVKFYLKKIRLINFRGFSNLSIDLSTDSVIIAANNGYGKTGILESIYNCLTWLIKNFKASGANGNSIKIEDIRAQEGVESATVILDVSLMQDNVENSTYSINLSKTNSDAEEKQDSSYLEFRSLADLYRELGSLGHSIPVFAFYSVERGNTIRKNDFKKSSDYSNIDFGSNDYALNISNSPKFEAFLAWILSEKTKKAMKYFTNSKTRELEKNINTLAVLESLKSEDPAIEIIINDLKKSINKAKPNTNYNEENEFTEKVNMVFSAIYTFMPEVKNFTFEYDEKINPLSYSA